MLSNIKNQYCQVILYDSAGRASVTDLERDDQSSENKEDRKVGIRGYLPKTCFSREQCVQVPKRICEVSGGRGKG